MRTKPYVGFRAGKRPVVFRATATPTEASHGNLYLAVMGPFRTVRAARLTARTHPNPHIYHVTDAERIAERKV
ncbi:MAG TPA: hypothetical protein VFU31_21240 [Candidatus Binatia bacterium]|nr:hypothetical protein [Candidatus Binatia bacterium]